MKQITQKIVEARTKRGNNILNSLSNLDEKINKNVHSDKNPKKENIINFSNSHKKIEQAIKKADFHNAFIPLKIKRDHYRGIKTTYYELKDDHRLIRDARSQKKDYKFEVNYYKYVQLGLNYLSGMIDLFKIENKRRQKENKNAKYIDINQAKTELSKLAVEFYKEITGEELGNSNEQKDKKQKELEESAEAKFGRFYHSVILPSYRQYRSNVSDKELNDELTIARDFANMKVKPYAVATISQHEILLQKNNKKINVAEIELPMVELTEKQKTYYRHRYSKHWFKYQSRIARALIDQYTPDIISGDAMIPAQLIYHLIGTRNGYEKWTAVLNHEDQKDKETKPLVINKAYHAGSQGHMLKLPDLKKNQNKNNKNENTIRQKATDLTIDQILHLTNTKTVFVNTLVTPLLFNKDAKVAQQIKKSVENFSGPKNKKESKKAFYANLPLNVGRRLGTRNTTGFTELLKIAKDALNTPEEENKKTYLGKIENYFKKPKDKSAQHDFKKHVVELFNSYINLKEWLQYPSTSVDPNNHNLEISAQANLLVFALNEFYQEENQKTSYSLISGCFSGQDRGGMVSTHTTNLAIDNYIKTTGKYKKNSHKLLRQQESEIYQKQALAGHTQEMTGNAGTGFGGEGIKIPTRDAIPNYYSKEVKNILTSKTGYLNEHLPPDPAIPIYRKKSFWIGVALAAVGIGLCATGILAIKGIVLLMISSVIIKSTLSHIGKKRLGKSPYSAITIQKHLCKGLPKEETKINDEKNQLNEKSKKEQANYNVANKVIVDALFNKKIKQQHNPIKTQREITNILSKEWKKWNITGNKLKSTFKNIKLTTSRPGM